MATSLHRGSRDRRLALALCALVATAACGKKGAPLPPLHLVPGPVTEFTARRTGSEVQLRFVLPTTNVNGPGRIELDRVEVYAVTVAPGSVTPPNRDLLTKTYLAGTIAVKPAPIDGEETEPVAGAAPDARPSPGDHVTFVEELTAERVKPAPLPKAPPVVVPATPAAGAAPSSATPPDATATAASAQPAAAPAAPPAAAPPPGPPPAVATAPPATTPAVTAAPNAPPAAAAAPAAGAAAAPGTATPGAAPAVPAPPPPTYIIRIYTVRGVTKNGRPGQPATRVAVPLVPPPAAPGAATASFTEQGITLAWTAPAAAAGAPPPAFNVYRAGSDATPVNPAPLTTAALVVALGELGTEQCFVVRSVEVMQNVRVESDPTARTCVTPRDTFPPAAPQGASVLVLDGAIELVWDANAEPDLAGYTVLRGNAPGDTLRPLTPSPIRETTFRDATVTPGTRYIYALVAVDRTGNASAQSARLEGIAR